MLKSEAAKKLMEDTKRQKKAESVKDWLAANGYVFILGHQGDNDYSSGGGNNFAQVNDSITEWLEELEANFSTLKERNLK